MNGLGLIRQLLTFIEKNIGSDRSDELEIYIPSRWERVVLAS